jgi:hypothetical protein
MLRLVDAMIVVECGQHISEKAIRDGYLHAWSIVSFLYWL